MAENKLYYLYNGQAFWTMSAAWYFKQRQGVYSVYYDGELNRSALDSAIGIRPVINLKADVMFAVGGSGEQNSPYVVQ